MNALEIVPITEIVEELKRRNISFLIAWADHQQFTKDDTDIVWAIDRGGNLPLQLTLLRLMNEYLADVTKVRMSSTEDDSA